MQSNVHQAPAAARVCALSVILFFGCAPEETPLAVEVLPGPPLSFAWEVGNFSELHVSRCAEDCTACEDIWSVTAGAEGAYLPSPVTYGEVPDGFSSYDISPAWPIYPGVTYAVRVVEKEGCPGGWSSCSARECFTSTGYDHTCTAGSERVCRCGGLSKEGTQACLLNGTWGNCIAVDHLSLAECGENEHEDCLDKIDNNGDGKIDCDDPSCVIDPPCMPIPEP